MAKTGSIPTTSRRAPRAVAKRPAKPLWKTIRKPVPKKAGGPLGGKKGGKGYERPREKERLDRLELSEERPAGEETRKK